MTFSRREFDPERNRGQHSRPPLPVAEMSDEASTAEASSEASRGLGNGLDASSNQELVNCQCYLSLDPYPSQHQWR